MCAGVLFVTVFGGSGALKASLVKDYSHKMPEAPLLSHTSVALLSYS